MDNKGEQIFFNDYKDRGMKKWAGFFLSEHVSSIEKQTLKDSMTVQQRNQMDEFEINEVITQAITKSKSVSVQISVVDSEGRYAKDIEGMIRGYDENEIFIGHSPIRFEEIRNIEILEVIKWTQS